MSVFDSETNQGAAAPSKPNYPKPNFCPCIFWGGDSAAAAKENTMVKIWEKRTMGSQTEISKVNWESKRRWHRWEIAFKSSSNVK